ncbi:MAG TPA: DUF1385 domain-containing protein [Polyangiaceae bacterium]
MSNQPPVLGPDGVARPYIGGQALIEGVMMRSPHSFVAAVRRQDGSLVLREKSMPDLRRGVRAWPLVRGVMGLVEALKLGSEALRFSADVYERDMEASEARTGAPEQPAEAVKGSVKKPSVLAALSLPVIALLTTEPADLQALDSGDKPDPKRKLFTVLAVLFAIGLFIALPQAFAWGTSSLLGLDLDVREPRFQVLTGLGKLIIVIGYMLAIRRMPEIYRVFQYHGAEHKSIYVYEAGEELSVANARLKTRLHPRCGTTFLVMVALVSIVVFSALGPLMPQLGLGRLGDNLLFLLMKLPFLPVIAAITFEIQRLLARRCSTGPLRALLWPGFLVQKITTIEPDDSQLETALAALRGTLDNEANGDRQAPVVERSFEGYDALVNARS